MRERIRRIRKKLVVWGRSVASWLQDQKLGRDAVVLVGILSVASGVQDIYPGADRIAFGGLLLYVALWHGPVVARLVRPREKE